MATCYRHPTRETGVSCSNCDRPICTDCMTPTSVGMRCPDCARQTTKVHTIRSMQSEPRVTYTVIAVCVIAFLASGQFGVNSESTRVFQRLALDGPDIAFGHEYWRLITGGFLHAGIIHIAFNMYLLYVLGRMLEPALGSLRFGFLYAAALLAGSFGALLVEPRVYTVGASGAVFGLMAAGFLEQRARGIDPMQTGLGGLILINLVFSFVLSNISIGGHIGGLVGGAAATWLMHQAERRRLPRTAQLAAPALVAVISVIGALIVAGGEGLGG